MLTLQEAVKGLDLGSYKDVIRILESEGIKGVQGNIYECPLALYFSRVTGRSVYVGVRDAVLYSIPVTEQDVREPLPPAARQLMHNFDGSRWSTRKLRA